MRSPILCFFGDQKHWENAPRLLMWPRGVLYDHPFRYRLQWIPESLLSSISTWDGRDALLCMKDSTLPNLYVPLRFGKIIKIETQGEYRFLHFSVEDFVDYRKAADLNHYSDGVSKTIPSGQRDKLVGETDLESVGRCPSDADAENWDVLTKLLIKDQSVPACQRIATAVFLRIIAMVNSADTEVLPQGDKSGFRIRTDGDYKLRFMVVIPEATNRGLDVGPFQLQIDGPFSSAQRILGVTSSYDPVDFAFRSAERKALGRKIVVSSGIVTVRHIAKGTGLTLQVPAAEIPITVKPSFTQILSRNVIPPIMVASGIVLQGLAPVEYRPVAVPVGAALAALGIFYKR